MNGGRTRMITRVLAAGAILAVLLLGAPAAYAVPANDNFENAIVIPSAPYSNSQSTVGATTEAGEPSPCGDIGSTVWYRFTPSSAVTVTIETFGSSYDTALAAYTGSSVGELTNVACNGDNGRLGSRIQFSASAGTTYQIQAGGVFGGAGSLVLNLAASVPPPPPPTPENDNFGNAIVIPSAPYTNSQSTTGATTEAGEPTPCGAMGSTVWYRYVHTGVTPIPLVITTRDSTFDTIAAAYRGTSLSGLTLLACNNNSGYRSHSMPAFVAEPGQTYYLQIGGVAGGTGNLRLRVTNGAAVDTGIARGAVAADPSYQEVGAAFDTVAGSGAVSANPSHQEVRASGLGIVGVGPFGVAAGAFANVRVANGSVLERQACALAYTSFYATLACAPGAVGSPASLVAGQGTIPSGAEVYVGALARNLSSGHQGRGVVIVGGVTVSLQCAAVLTDAGGNHWLFAFGNVMFDNYNHRFILGYDSPTGDYIEVSATGTSGSPCLAPTGTGLQPLTGPGLVIAPSSV